MRRAVRSAGFGGFLALFLGLVSVAGAVSLPPGFSQDVVATGLTEPTAISFFPDGRIAIAEKSGIVRLVKNGALLPLPLIDLSARVNDFWDRGLLGIAVDPDFPSNPHVYLLYVFENDANDYFGTKTARLTRVTVTGDTASPASEVVILGTTTGPRPGPAIRARTTRPAPTAFPRTAPRTRSGTSSSPPTGRCSSPWATRRASPRWILTPCGPRTSTPWPGRCSGSRGRGRGFRRTRSGPGTPAPTGRRCGPTASGTPSASVLRPGSNMPYVGDVGWDAYEEINVARAGREPRLAVLRGDAAATRLRRRMPPARPCMRGTVPDRCADTPRNPLRADSGVAGPRSVRSA